MRGGGDNSFVNIQTVYYIFEMKIIHKMVYGRIHTWLAGFYIFYAVERVLGAIHV